MNKEACNIFEVLGTTNDEKTNFKNLIQSKNNDIFSIRLKTAKFTFLDKPKLGQPFREESIKVENLILTVQKEGENNAK